MLNEMPTVGANLPGLRATAQLSAPYEFRSIHANGTKPVRQEFRIDSATMDETADNSLDAVRSTAFEDGRREGEDVARAAAERATAASLTQERTRISVALQDFREKQNQYFAAMEHEVVRLALAIAARVLHREVQLDPLLLAGVARVALDKLADRSGVTLRVPVANFSEWQKVFESMDTLERPDISADPCMGLAECVLDTRMGTVELGVAAQLDEIERGFFDLLNHRPAV